MITDCLQGELEAVTLAGTGKAKDSAEDAVDLVPFLMLGALRCAALRRAQRCCAVSHVAVPCAVRLSKWIPAGATALCKEAGLPVPAAPVLPLRLAVITPGLLCTAGLDLPAAPLFKDALEKVIIPQVGG